MVAGHFGLAAAVKGRETATPLWILMLATAWLDVVFIPLVLTGFEGFERVPGSGAYGGLVIHADYTHSLVGALVLSALLGLPAAKVWGTRSGLIVGLVSFSHWLLDLIVHRADLALLPGNAGNLPKLGFGLWRLPVATAAVELALILVGAIVYWRAADELALASGRPGSRRRALANGAMVLVFGALVLGIDVSGLGG